MRPTKLAAAAALLVLMVAVPAFADAPKSTPQLVREMHAAHARTAALNAEVDKATRDPHAMRAAYSAELCEAQEDIASARQQIATERNLARQAGVLNLARLESAKSDLAMGEVNAKEARVGLRELRASAIPCNQLDLVLTCSRAPSGPQCGGDEVVIGVRLLHWLENGTDHP